MVLSRFKFGVFWSEKLDCAEEEIDSLIGRENETPVQADITARYHTQTQTKLILSPGRWCKAAVMLFLQSLQILMAMMIATVTGGRSLSKEDLIKLDRNVVQMYEMVHTKVKVKRICRVKNKIMIDSSSYLLDSFFAARKSKCPTFSEAYPYLVTGFAHVLQCCQYQAQSLTFSHFIYVTPFHLMLFAQTVSLWIEIWN